MILFHSFTVVELVRRRASLNIGKTVRSHRGGSTLLYLLKMTLSATNMATLTLTIPHAPRIKETDPLAFH